MASLNGTFDANSVQPAAAIETLPPGDYRAEIINSEMRATKDGAGEYLWLELNILDGECANRHLFDRLNLVNNNPQAADIAQRTLSAICHATGQMQVSDSDQLHHKPMTITVKVKPASGQYGASNEIKGYKAGGSSASRSPGAPAAHVAAAAGKSAATAPWRRG